MECVKRGRKVVRLKELIHPELSPFSSTGMERSRRYGWQVTGALVSESDILLVLSTRREGLHPHAPSIPSHRAGTLMSSHSPMKCTIGGERHRMNTVGERQPRHRWQTFR